jgi:hypothetical protein
VQYNGAAQAVGDFTYYNLTLSGSGAKDLSTVGRVTTINNNFAMSGTATAAPVAALTIGGNVTLGSGTTFTGGGFTHNVAGNWTNNGATFTNTNNTINLNGTVAQTVGGTATTTFNNLILNNTFGTIPQIILGINTTVGNSLTMTSGVVNLAGFTFTLGAAATVSSISRVASATTNWMYGGTFSRFWLSGTAVSSTVGNMYGLFPVGALIASSYRPVQINSNASPTGNGSFSVTHTDATTVTDLSPVYSDAGTNIVRKHNSQFVTATTATGGTYDISVTMTNLPAGTLSDIRLAVSNGATTVTDFGNHLAATGTAQNPTAARTGGLITLANLVGDWRITTINSVNTPLPIELLSFTGLAVKNGVDLQWTTASELNNNYFTVLRSLSGDNFTSIGTVKGSGTTSLQHSYSLLDYQPAIGKNYYQLQQVDFNGKISTTEVIVVNVISLDPSVSVYPNPISQGQSLNVTILGLLPNAPAELQIANMQGASLSSTMVQTDSDGTLKATISSTNLPSGLYILKIQNVCFKFVIE